MKQSKLLFTLVLMYLPLLNAQENLGFQYLDFTNWELFIGEGYEAPTIPEVAFGIDDPNTRHTLNTIDGTDSYTFGMLQIIPEGELYSARLGNENVNYETDGLRYSFTVDDNTGFLYYKYALVFQNPTSHVNTQPLLIINTYVNGVVQPCESYSVDANIEVSEETGFNYGTPGVKWKGWTTVGMDLSNYDIGDVIVFEFENYDCGAGGHFGYTYLLAGYTDDVITQEPCGDDGNYYLFAPEGYTYLWNTGETTQFLALNNPSPGTVYTCELTLIIEDNICDALVVETTIEDYNCCKPADFGFDLTPDGVAGNIGYSTNLPALVEDMTFYINGTYFIVDDLEFYNCEVNFGPNGKIKVLPNVSFGDKGYSVFQPCDDSFLWDGVYDTYSPEALRSLNKFNNSKFISAKSALNYQKFNLIWTHDVQFKACHTAMDLKDYNLDISDYPSNYVSFTESEIYGGPLNEEHEGAVHSTNGIKLKNCKDVLIGHHDNGVGLPDLDLSDLCEFNSLRTGIDNYNSVLHIKNSDFYNPSNSTARGINSQSLSTSTVYDCGVNAENCYFTDYSKGIYQYGPVAQHVNVWNSTFKNNSKGIQSYCLGQYYLDGGSKIRRNHFYDTTYGVDISGFNTNGALIVSANTFKNTYKKSIWIKNIDSYFTIFGGTEYSEGVKVAHNRITYDEDVESNLITGISLNNCQGFSGPQIYQNRLTYYERPNSVNYHRYRGIEVKDVINGYVDDNDIVAWGEGIRVVGHDEVLSFRCNDFLDCYSGFRFTADLPAGESYISQQGAFNRPHNNYFYGDIEERFSGELSMVEAIDWWSNASWLTNIVLTSDLIGFINPSYTTFPSYCISYEPLPSVGGIEPEDDEPTDPNPDGPEDELKMAILLDYTDPYVNTEDGDATLFRNKYLYSLVELQPEIQSAGEVELLSNLYTILLESNLAKMVGIEKHISAREFTAAVAKNDAFIASSLSEIVNKEVYTIWLDTWAKDQFDLTEEQENSLLDYALLSPYYGGEAVYLARIMLGIDIDDYEIDYRIEASSPALSTVVPWRVYTDNAYIYIEPQEKAKGFVLYSIMGKEVYSVSQEIPVGGQTVLTLPNLPQGLYVYQLLNKQGQAIYTNKLILH